MGTKARRSAELQIEIWSACLLLASLSACAPVEPEGQPPAAPPDLVIRDATVITLTEAGVLEGWQVLVRDGEVADLAARRPPHWPAGARVVDASGRYLVPALHDLHVHVFDERDLETYALMGIATVRNMDGWGWHLDLAREDLRTDSWRARLLTAGAQVQPPLVESAADVERLIAEEAERGFDWIKAYDGLSLELLAAVARASRRSGVPVTGHLPDGVDAEEALATGAYADVAHAEELLEWFHRVSEGGGEEEAGSGIHLDRLARSFEAAGTALVTTLISNRMILEQRLDLKANLARDEVGLAAPMLQVFWRSPFNPYAGPVHHHDADHAGRSDAVAVERGRKDQRILQQIVAGLHRRGVTLLAGTDAPNPTTVPADSLYTELELLVEAGLTPEAALRTATAAAADHLGNPLGGRVRIGAPADLLLLDADPLERIANLRRRAGLVLRGRFLDGAEAEDRLGRLRRTFATEAEVLGAFDPASPAAIVEVLDGGAREGGPQLSAPALTSLVWVYTKFGKAQAAETVARLLVRLYPGERSDRVLAAVQRRNDR